MVNYHNSKVYKIESYLGDKIYIGSTTKLYLSQRMAGHKNDYDNWKHGLRGKVMSFELFDEYGFENCSIILLESIKCESKDELKQRESHYINSLMCINKNIPGRPKKEYNQDKKESITQWQKTYNDKNKEKIKEYKKTYKQDHKEQTTCECGGSYDMDHRARHFKTIKHLKYLKQQNEN